MSETTGSELDSAQPDRPLLRIVTPDATAEEIAALVAVLSAAAPAGGEPPTPRRSEWSAPHRAVRVRYSHGPGGWRSSGLPR